MIIKTSIEKLANDIGFDIANSDDITQADLLNGLGRGFKMCNEYQNNLQLSYVVDKLNNDAEKFIMDLSEFIKLKNDRK